MYRDFGVNPVNLTKPLEGLQMMGQQELWRIAHGAAPFRSPMYERAEVVATSARGR